MNKLKILILALAIFQASCVFELIEGSDFNECSGSDNELSNLDGTLHFVNETSNGKKYLLVNGTYSSIGVAVLQGSPYDVGYAYGQLFGEEIRNCMHDMLDYVVEQVQQYINTFPPYLRWLKFLPLKSFFDGTLDVEDLDTFLFTPDQYAQELKGISDGSGVNYNSILRINLFPELIKAACTIVGAWGNATYNEKLVQMRALDWDASAPMGKYPVIVVYNFNITGAYKFANIGWAGMIGSLAGFSERVAVCEKVWLPEASNDSSRFGTPWMYVLRDVLNYAGNLSQGLEMIGNAHRTCQIYVGLGALEDNRAVIMEYSAKDLVVWTDTNYTPYTTAHPQINDVVYLDKHVQPSGDGCLGSTLVAGYGSIDAEYLYRTVAGNMATGNTLLAVYDFDAQFVYVAYSDIATGTPAYLRAMTPVNMTELFNIF